MNAVVPTDLEFEPWVEHVFSHATPMNGVAWYFDVDAQYWDGSPALTNAHVTRLFENPVPPLAYFSDAQIAQGLLYLIDSGASNSIGSALAASVELSLRQRAIASIATLFEQLIEPRVTPVLGHLGETGAALNGAAYMWWDIFPWAGKARADGSPDPIDESILSVMGRILASQHPALQESALHGLGHWVHAYPDIARPMIEDFLRRSAAIRPELSKYARAAMSGCVL